MPEIADGDRRAGRTRRLLGHGHAPLRLAARGQGQRRRRLLPLRADGEDIRMTAAATVGRHAAHTPDDIQRYGAADVSACFWCGTCTATCPLVEEDATFPRRIIRYAQVGMRDELLVEQGAVDVLRLRRVLGELPDAGRAERVHGLRAALRHRQLRPHRAGPADVHATFVGTARRHRPGGLLRRCSCTRPTAR